MNLEDDEGKQPNLLLCWMTNNCRVILWIGVVLRSVQFAVSPLKSLNPATAAGISGLMVMPLPLPDRIMFVRAARGGMADTSVPPAADHVSLSSANW